MEKCMHLFILCYFHFLVWREYEVYIAKTKWIPIIFLHAAQAGVMPYAAWMLFLLKKKKKKEGHLTCVCAAQDQSF